MGKMVPASCNRCAHEAFVVLNGSNRHATHRVMPGMADVLIWKRIGRQVFWILAQEKTRLHPSGSNILNVARG
jgi:hypothetical protein